MSKKCHISGSDYFSINYCWEMSYYFLGYKKVIRIFVLKWTVNPVNLVYLKLFSVFWFLICGWIYFLPDSKNKYFLIFKKLVGNELVLPHKYFISRFFIIVFFILINYHAIIPQTLFRLNLPENRTTNRLNYLSFYYLYQNHQKRVLCR